MSGPEPKDAGPIRVLLADDQALVRGALAALLNLEPDIEVVAQTGDGTEVVALAEEHRVDVALLDIQMPVMDGLETTREIRKLPGAFAHPPILALTANAMTHQREQYLAAGMNGVVAKPISPAALLSEIARLTPPGEVQQAS